MEIRTQSIYQMSAKFSSKNPPYLKKTKHAQIYQSGLRPIIVFVFVCFFTDGTSALPRNNQLP
jgi:hypothetical protein